MEQKIARPAPGQNMIIPVGQVDAINLGFDLEGATLVVQGQDLVISFGDGASLTLAGLINAAADQNAAPLLIQENGEALPSYALLSSLDGGAEALETAAGGGAGGGGAGEYRSNPGDMYGSLNRLGGLDATSDRGLYPEVDTDPPELIVEEEEGGSAPALTSPAAVPPTGPVAAAPAAPAGPVIPDPGTPDPGTPDPGTPDPGTPDPGTPDPGTPDPGTPDPGDPDPLPPLAQGDSFKSYEDSGQTVADHLDLDSDSPNLPQIKGNLLANDANYEGGSHGELKLLSVNIQVGEDEKGNPIYQKFDITGDNTEVSGRYGAYVFNLDGSFIYTPDPANQDIIDLYTKNPTEANKLTENLGYTTANEHGLTADSQASLDLIPNKIFADTVGKSNTIENFGDGHDVALGDINGDFQYDPQNYNVTLVLDISGSMKDEFSTALEAVQSMLAKLQQYAADGKGSVYVTLVTFSNDSAIKWYGELTADTDIAAITKGLSSNGATNYMAGFNRYAEHYEANKDAIDDALDGDYQNVMYFITDGAPTKHYINLINDIYVDENGAPITFDFSQSSYIPYSSSSGTRAYFDADGNWLGDSSDSNIDGAMYRFGKSGGFQVRDETSSTGWRTVTENAVAKTNTGDFEYQDMSFSVPADYVLNNNERLYYDAEGNLVGRGLDADVTLSDGMYRISWLGNLQVYNAAKNTWTTVKNGSGLVQETLVADSYTSQPCEVVGIDPSDFVSGQNNFYYDASGNRLSAEALSAIADFSDLSALKAAGIAYYISDAGQLQKLGDAGWQDLGSIIGGNGNSSSAADKSGSLEAYQNLLDLMDDAGMDVNVVGINRQGDRAAPDEEYLENFDQGNGKVTIIDSADDLESALVGGTIKFDFSKSWMDFIDGGAGNDLLFGDGVNTAMLAELYAQKYGQDEDYVPLEDGLLGLLNFIMAEYGVEFEGRVTYENMDSFINQNSDLIRAFVQENHFEYDLGNAAKGSADFLVGDEGNDVLYGQGGADMLMGGGFDVNTYKQWWAQAEATVKVAKADELQRIDKDFADYKSQIENNGSVTLPSGETLQNLSQLNAWRESEQQALVAEQLQKNVVEMVQKQGDADQIQSGSAADGANYLDGGADNDVLISGKGYDVMVGGDGDDVLISTGGVTIMYGGDGDDVFMVAGSDLTLGDEGVWEMPTDWFRPITVIADWDEGDVLDLSGFLASLGYDNVTVSISDYMPSQSPAPGAEPVEDSTGVLIQVLLQGVNEDGTAGDGSYSVHDIYVYGAKSEDLKAGSTADENANLVLGHEDVLDDVFASDENDISNMEDLLNSLVVDGDPDAAADPLAAGEDVLAALQPDAQDSAETAQAKGDALQTVTEAPDLSSVVLPADDPVAEYQETLAQQQAILTETGN